MKVFIAADHKGIKEKQEIKSYLQANDISVEEIDLKNYELDDYPDFAFQLGEKIIKEHNSLGILICGNGVGMSIAANKVKGIRAVRAVGVDDAFKGKNHNGANVLCLGSNLSLDLMKEIIDTFITTKAPSEERYLRRMEKIIKYENGEYNEL